MKMKRMWIAALCLGCLTLAGSARLLAAGTPQTSDEQELKAKMAAQGWKEISQGVYQRQRGPDKFEHLGYGREGFVWMVGDLTRQRDELVQAYQKYPSEDLHKVIDQLSVKIADLKRELRNTKSLSGLDDKVTGASCNICYSATADGYPLSGSAGQGVGAIADASFSSNCGYSGDTYAYAYAQATLGGTTTTHTQSDGPYTGTSVTAHASATVNGSSNCSSNANSYATSTALGISYSTSDSNTLCPPPPLTVSISGTSATTIIGYASQTLTWTANVSGGTAPYTYSWTIDGTSGGTASTASRTYTGTNTIHTQTVNVSVTVHDSGSQTASASYTTTIYYTTSGGGGGGGGCSVVSVNGSQVACP